MLLALAVKPAGAAREQLLDGKAAMERARASLLDGDLESARSSFLEAEGSFGRAVDLTRTPLLRLAGLVPVLRRTPITVAAIAEAGAEVALAGRHLTDGILALPGGMAALGPQDGRIDPVSFAALAPALERARALVSGASDTVEATPDGLLLGPVASARADAIDQLSSLDETMATAQRLFERLPWFLGADEPRAFFVGAQNPAELRGTGGLIGAFSILRIEDGRFAFDRFRPTQSLPNFTPREIEPPSREYARNYNPFGGAGYWLNINMTPDFPLASAAILTAYEQARDEALDGVIVADPFALAGLLELTGPVEIPDLGTEIDAGNVAAYVANEAYAEFPDPDVRKSVLGSVAQQVFERFMESGSPSGDWVRALSGVAGGGHLKVFATDDQLEAALGTTGVAGELPSPPGDFLAVVQNNGGGNKLDFYLDRSVTYRVRLLPDGSAEATVQLDFENHAPDSGLPQYVIGPYQDVSEAGENVGITSMYCTADCRLLSVTRNDEPIAVTVGEELGHAFFQDYVKIPSGESASVVFEVEIGNAWEPAEGLYHLTFVNQTTFRPTDLRVEVVAPTGLLPAQGDGLELSGDRAVWEGTPGRTLELEIGLERL